MTMKYLTELLPESKFVRVHRSYVVNFAKIVVLAKNQVQIAGTEIPIGESYKDSLAKITF